MRRGDRGFTLAGIGSSDATAPLSGHTTRPEPADASSGLHQGSTLGRYVVLSRLGSGGAGSVYAAYDTQIDRRVALKILHAAEGETANAWSQRWDRVVAEARLLGKLNHPNVVTVYDVDTVDDVSFIAMELVDGQDLASWSEAAPRSLQEVLAVFVGAAQGLRAAHAGGIVHGDFKPANVLVGADGRARVSDFGVARVQAEVTRENAEHSHDGELESSASSTLGHLPGTPFYMAPEQHDGRPPDPRSDIYSLCLALHEVAYGRRAFQATTFGALALAKEEGPPPAPADARSLPAWLRQVLTRGLAPDPSDRFADVGELLAALDRPSRSSRARLTAAIGVVGLTLGATAWLRAAEDEPCQGAARHLVDVWDDAAKARVRDTMLGTEVSYAADTWERTEELLDEYAGSWVDMHTRACEATQRGEQSSALLDRRMHCLERKRGSLSALVEVLAEAPDAAVVRNSPDAARELPGLEACDDTERMLEGPAPAEDPARPGVEDELARAYALAAVGKYDEALKAALAAQTRSPAIDDDPLKAEVMLAVGSMQARTGAHEVARESLEAAHFGAERAHADRTAAEAAVRLVSVVGDSLRRSEAGLVWGQHADAAIGRAGDDPILRAQLDAHLGTVFTQAARLDEAEAAFARAEAAHVERFGEHAPELTVVINGLGGVAVERKDYAAARRHYERALEIKRRHLGPRHPSLGTTWLNLGIAAKNLGEYEEARGRYEMVRDLWEEALGPEHPSLGVVHNNLGTLASATGEDATARDEYSRACEIWRAALEPDHPDVSLCLMNLGSAERALGNLERARSLLGEALELRRARLGDEHPFIAITHINLGDVELEAKDPAAALRHFELARAVWEAALPADHPDHAYALSGIGRAHLDLGRAAEAIEPLERAVALRSADEIEPRLAATSRFMLARALVAAGRDRGPARALALEAQGLFASAGGTHEASDEVAQWLSENAPATER